MSREGLALAVPEGVHKDLVVLDGNGAHNGVQVKGAPLEHHAVLIVHAGAFREDEQGGAVRLEHMLLHALCHFHPVLDLR